MKQSDVCRGRTADIRKGTGIDMDQLKKANEYVKQNRIPKEELPVFHVTPPCGWMNDPNGFSVYQGKTHLFYQFHPYSTVWGPMHWGHYETEDFVKWTELPAALAPDQAYDEAGCFSGSGIETEKGHLLVYTGVKEKEEDGQKYTYQNQCIALGDGKAYNKLVQNPVVTGDMLPKGFSREHFRDPKIWKEDDGYYMVVGNKTDQGKPQVVLFHSENAVEWEYVSVLAEDKNGNLGTMWECPDFFELDGEYILLASPQDLCAGSEFHNGNNAVYYTGSYDRGRHVFDYSHVYSLDDGLDFYASQTMLSADGRRILIGWMQTWDANIRPADQKWACMMTIPRELRLDNGRILQSPVRELEKYYSNSVHYDQCTIKGTCQKEGIRGRVLDMTVELLEGDYTSFDICFAQNEKHFTKFTYDRAGKTIEIDRTYCGMIRDVLAQRKVPVKVSGDVVKIRMILDKYSAEIFINEGAQVMSTTFYTPLDADQISFVCDGSVTVNIDKYDISIGEMA